MEHSLFSLFFVVTPSLHYFIIKEEDLLILKHCEIQCLIPLCTWGGNNEPMLRKKNNFNVKTFEQ